MKMNNRFIYGILSLILAAIVAFIAIPAVQPHHANCAHEIGCFARKYCHIR